jgi:hypothetical protein
MKKLVNDPADVVSEALRGMAAATPKVGLISGGGSGDEPLHGGFVGVGMLDAAGRWPGQRPSPGSPRSWPRSPPHTCKPAPPMYGQSETKCFTRGAPLAAERGNDAVAELGP